MCASAVLVLVSVAFLFFCPFNISAYTFSDTCAQQCSKWQQIMMTMMHCRVQKIDLMHGKKMGWSKYVAGVNHNNDKYMYHWTIKTWQTEWKSVPKASFTMFSLLAAAHDYETGLWNSLQSRTQSLLTSFSACSTKTKGSGKDRFLGNPDWSSEM